MGIVPPDGGARNRDPIPVVKRRKSATEPSYLNQILATQPGDNRTNSDGDSKTRRADAEDDSAERPADEYLRDQCESTLTRFLTWLLHRHDEHGGLTEIRARVDNPGKMVWSGYFDSAIPIDFIRQILPDSFIPRKKIPFGETPLIGEASFYFTMQPVKPALHARSANNLSRCDCTSDHDIACYDLFAVDVDPVRPSGISATDEEKRCARIVAEAIGRWFASREIGFMLADSGNGYHLLIPTIPYSDVDAACANAKTLLKLLDSEFSTEGATVDTTICNPSRILKLYGTQSVKGSNLADRPHRFAQLLGDDFPTDVDLFGLLEHDLVEFRSRSESSAGGKTPSSNTENRNRAAKRENWGAEKSNKGIRPVKTLLDRHGRVEFFSIEEAPSWRSGDPGRTLSANGCGETDCVGGR